MTKHSATVSTMLHISYQCALTLCTVYTVLCFPKQAESCTEGELRLVGGDTEREGLVEFCSEGSFGTACLNGVDIRDASVVCRALEFSGGQCSHHYKIRCTVDTKSCIHLYIMRLLP